MELNEYCPMPSGYKYDEIKNDLTDSEDSFLRGMNDVRNYIETAFSNYETDEETVLGKLKSEIAEELEEHVLAFVDSWICEALVSFGDNHPEEE